MANFGAHFSRNRGAAAGVKCPLMANELDELTLGRARRGEPAALSSLIKHYERQVFALCARLLCSSTREGVQVEDVAQEAFIRVLGGLSRFDPAGPARLSTWILTVATRTCLNSMRGKRREVPLGDEDHGRPAEVASPEASAVDRDLGRRVEAAMATLPEDMRAVLVLRAYHDLDYPEIAQALELEIGTVKSRLSRARAALRGVLEMDVRLKEQTQ